MLEYALFDLSGFVQPTVVPTLSVTFSPSPLTVKSGDTADQLTVNVNSGTNETDSSAVLSFTLPAGLTITGMSDPTGGWICTVATMSCSRTSGPGCQYHRFRDSQHQRDPIPPDLKLFGHDYRDGFERYLFHQPLVHTRT